MTKKPLAAALAAIILMCMVMVSGCGATRQLLSITASSTALTSSTSTGFTIAQTRELVGLGGSEQIFIIANYTGGNAHTDVTTQATYVSSNPSVVSVNRAGVIEVMSGFCSWVSSTAVDPNLLITVTATFQNMSTNISVAVNSLSNCPGPTTQQ